MSPAPEERLNRIERMCRRKGLKMTGQRRAIARALIESRDHPDVQTLHRRAAALDPRISLATVYRAVRLFEECGALARHEFGDGRARYEETPETHHDHLIDMDTGAVIEFRSEAIEALQEEMARQLGYELLDHRLELYGRRRSDGGSVGSGGSGDSGGG